MGILSRVDPVFLSSAGRRFFVQNGKEQGKNMKHLLDPMDITTEEIDELLDLADEIIKNPEK